jgi:hypothetical protein
MTGFYKTYFWTPNVPGIYGEKYPVGEFCWLKKEVSPNAVISFIAHLRNE